MTYSSFIASQRELESDSILKYDPRAIARYYNNRPWLGIFRSLKIITLFGIFVIQLYLDKLFKQEEKNKLKRAERLRKILTSLGATFIKVGQALSTRPDLIKPDFLEELIKLQDQLPPFDNETAFDIIERELDMPVNQAYKEISPNPVAAASLGQVYRATLHTGEAVAVKVQRPQLLPVITLDLYLLRLGSKWVAPFLPLNLGHDLTLIVDEFGIKLFEEIDYVNEGRNAEKFAANFRDDDDVKVPHIYWRYTSHKVLTLEWINGCKLNDFESIRAAGLDPNDVIKVGVTSGLRQLLEHGFFHADPHPGNLFAMPDGRMAYIDFGMMDQLDEYTKETIASSVVQLINGDYEALARDFVELGFLTPETDITPIIPALEKVLGNAVGQSVGNFNFKTITDDFSELMYEYPFRVPAKFALIIRSLVTQEGLALSLNPDFKIVEVSFPYISRRLLTEESPAMRRRLLEVLFKDDKFQWQRLENMIQIAKSDHKFDLLPTAGLGFQYLVSEEGDFLRRQIISALVEDDRLHTQEVQRLWQLVQADLKPRKLFDVAVNAVKNFSFDLAKTGSS
ncbi:AarF/ABC1/UbiB kinase family protein [Cyanobacterium stanieri LEGE 03274]|uniref:AarF/ABC1/UbiB kinase family protein n=1 Tax=Cyanobacterium stanieri LEGE 03274 TaxID=1828756 RepID=A0ABR9V6Q8_9CHRO|nr:AarF/ABC1/UbiB kinase family protein [Cyanobacterium stanieri LEGE 03274]